MARYKLYDYDQLMMVPVSLEEQLMPGTLEYAIHHVVEKRLELGMFDDRYCNDETGRKAIDPKVLIKVVLFGYSRGLITSRSLERACRENILNRGGSGNRNKGLILSPFLSRASVLRRGSEKLSMTQNNFLFLIQQKERFLKN